VIDETFVLVTSPKDLTERAASMSSPFRIPSPHWRMMQTALAG
jgi:hypothetical protein